MDNILVIVGIVVLFGVAGGCIFGVMKLQGLLKMMDTKVDPMLDDLKAKTEALKPAVAQVAPLMESVNVTIDALDVELVKIDQKLDDLQALTGKVSNVMETAPEVAAEAKRAVKSRLSSAK